MAALVLAALAALFATHNTTNTYGTNSTAQKASMALHETLTGKVTRVVDGDSLYLENHKLRLWGVDAPEVDTFGYEQAQKTLYNLVNGRTISCTCVDTDRYGRSIARCQLENGHDIGEILIRSGWALDYRKHTRGYYEKAEDEARENKRGLWGPR